MYKEIIILAKSSKHDEYCIAGVDITSGKWVRPISINTTKEGSVPLNSIIYEDGDQVRIFDKVKIKMLSHNPTISQPENYVFDSTEKWKKTGVS